MERVAAKVTMTCANPILTSENGNEAGGTISGIAFNLHGGATMAYRMEQDPFSDIKGNEWTYEVPGIDVLDDEDDYTQARAVYCLENIHTIAFAEMFFDKHIKRNKWRKEIIQSQSLEIPHTIFINGAFLDIAHPIIKGNKYIIVWLDTKLTNF